MLDFFRKGLQGRYFRILLGLLLLSFSFWGMQTYQTTSFSKAPVTVNGVPISLHDLNEAVWLMTQQAKRQLGEKAAIDSDTMVMIRKQALAALIRASLLAQDATKMGLAVSWSAVKEKVLQDALFQQNGQFSPEIYRTVLKQLGHTEAQFLGMAKEELLKAQVFQAFAASFLTPESLEVAHYRLNQTRDIRYALLSPENFMPSPLTLEDKQHYYETHLSEFSTPERVQIEYLVVSLDQLPLPKLSSEKELLDYYANQGRVVTDTMDHKRVEQDWLREKRQELWVSAQERLSELTYTTPESLKPAAQAFHLPLHKTEWFSTKGPYPKGIPQDPAFLEQVLSEEVLKKRNNSTVFSLENGEMIVLRVSEYAPARVKSFEEVSSSIEARLIRTARQREAEKAARLLVNQIQKDSSRLPENLGKTSIRWIAAPRLGRTYSAQVAHAIQDQIWQLSHPASSAWIPLPDSQGAAVVVLDRIHPPSSMTPLQRKTLTQALLKKEVEVTYQSYLNSLLNSADVVMHVQEWVQGNS